MKKSCKILCMAASFALLFGSKLMASDNNQLFGAGKGTIDSPYWVENAEQLKNVRLFPNAFFVQTCDIDMKDDEFIPIGDFENPFTGFYDGEGHRIIIENLGSTNGNIKLAGVWGFTSEADIRNLNVDIISSLKLDGRVCLGGIAACANKTIISNCSISSDSNIQVISEKCLYAGGIVGYSAFDSVIKNCSFEGRLNGYIP